jgi:hypothetical protein
MLLKIGKTFEIEVTRASLFLRVGCFERYYNMAGLPSH